MKQALIFLTLVAHLFVGCSSHVRQASFFFRQGFRVLRDNEPEDPAPGDPMYDACAYCNEFLMDSEFKTVPSHDGLVSVWGKYAGWTLVDVNPEWETVFPYDTLVLYRNAEGRYGFFDARAAWCRIPPTYDQAWPFSEGVAAVLKDKRVHFIDTLGRSAVGGYSFPWNGHYLDRFVFKSGLCAVADDTRRCGVMDLHGNWVVPPAYLDIEMEQDHILCIAPGVRHQYDYKGTLVNDCVVEAVVPLKVNGTATGQYYYEVSEKTGLMEGDGRRLTQPIYEEIVALSPTLYRARLSDGVSEVLLNRKGQIVR